MTYELGAILKAVYASGMQQHHLVDTAFWAVPRWLYQLAPGISYSTHLENKLFLDTTYEAE